MKTLLTAAAMAATIAAAPALAEDTAATPAPAAPAPAPAPAPAETVAPISDAELDKFAGAAIKVNEIAKDAALDAEGKQAAMVSAVQASGLEAVRFNEIATKSQTDEALKTRLAEAFARRPAAAAPAPAPATENDAAAEEQAGG